MVRSPATLGFLGSNELMILHNTEDTYPEARYLSGLDVS
jgi:hypothetical protein